jgi:ketosteroid isomerase-like protein
MSNDDVAEQLFAAIENGDVGTVRDLYSPDAVIWHNTDSREQSADQNLATLMWVVENLAERRYEDVRRSVTDRGFVQQHMMRWTKADGTRAELPACIVATCADGLITRIDEYLDSAHVARITA